MLALLLQGLLTLVASGVMLLLLQPEWYFIIGALTAAVAGGLILYVELEEHIAYAGIRADKGFDFGWHAVTILVVLTIGLFWPVVPCATAYGALVERDELLRGRSRER